MFISGTNVSDGSHGPIAGATASTVPAIAAHVADLTIS
jgi:hypothetical protein